jgi:branched-chain amino acid transport system substrate-binding protein
MWRVTPADDVKGYAMALWAHLRHFTRAAATFGNDIGSQGMVPTLQRGFAKLGGHIVINEKLALDQSSYRTEIERMLAAKPQVILSELDPQSSATFLAELQQLHGLNIPYIGTEVTLQAQWYQAVSRAIGKTSVARIVTGVQYYTPTGGQAWKYYNAALKPAGQKQATWNTDPYSMSYYDSVNVMALAATAATPGFHGS